MTKTMDEAGLVRMVRLLLPPEAWDRVMKAALSDMPAAEVKELVLRELAAVDIDAIAAELEGRA